MSLTLIAAATLAALVQAPDPGPVFSGRDGRTSVPIPRIEAEVAVDGLLGEEPWTRAAVLAGFSQYGPVDGLPAADSTEVLVWYSPTAIYFGVRAFESHGSPTATLADRDHIFGDDNIQILLGTFHDGRQAVMFAANPLGIQADGAIIEGTQAQGGFMVGATLDREHPDLSPDYVFSSRGHLTEWGYEIEIRIPFKSLRYQPAARQSWQLNIVRQVKHSAVEDSWAPALRARPSFLAQSGEITGLTDLRRGLVIDLNPEATERVDGARDSTGFGRSAGNPQLGGNVRWGITNNLTLNGTVHPDFSQVESDAGQLAFDPRFALFFPEKRPFFLEGSELFQTQTGLIYTRTIVQPVFAAKLTGNYHGITTGLLTAVDDQIASSTGSHPLFNIVRFQRSLGARSRLGVTYTDRIDGPRSNRVAALDGRLVMSNISSFDYEVAGSRTDDGSRVTSAPLWHSRLAMRGRTWGVTGLFSGTSDRFITQTGFLGRTGIVRANLDPSWTLNGRQGATLQRLTLDVGLDGTWQYQKFIHGRGIQDQKLHLNSSAVFRGGWFAAFDVFLESFGYDSLLYSSYRIEVPASGGGLDTIPFTGQPTIHNDEWLAILNTPQWQHFSASALYVRGHDENFFEWASGGLGWMQLAATWRPTDRVRLDLSYNWQQINRRTDGSLVNVGRIPRVKLEYQVARALFVRAVGQYVQQVTDSLRDDSRTNAPILIATPNGLVRTRHRESNDLHADVLVSYQPVPGTVILAGYGSDATDGRSFAFAPLQRTRDVWFVKVSYLFRLS